MGSKAAASGRPAVLGFPGDAGGRLIPAPNPVMRAGPANSKPYLRLFAVSLHRWSENWLYSLCDDADPSMPLVDTYDQLGYRYSRILSERRLALAVGPFTLVIGESLGAFMPLADVISRVYLLSGHFQRFGPLFTGQEALPT